MNDDIGLECRGNIRETGGILDHGDGSGEVFVLQQDGVPPLLQTNLIVVSHAIIAVHDKALAQQQPGEASDRGILTTHLRSDGRHKSKLYVDGGPSSTRTVGYLRMEGREVFKHAVGMITDVIYDAFKATGTTAEDIDWFVPHQANKRIIDASAHKLHIPPQKVVLTVDLHGNTSAASIPLALSVAVKDGRVKKGDLVLLEAMGGGFTWGSALLRW